MICLLHFAKVQRVDPRQVDESVVRALRKYFPTEAKVLSDPRLPDGGSHLLTLSVINESPDGKDVEKCIPNYKMRKIGIQ